MRVRNSNALDELFSRHSAFERDNPKQKPEGPFEPPTLMTQMYGPAVRSKKISTSWR